MTSTQVITKRELVDDLLMSFCTDVRVMRANAIRLFGEIESSPASQESPRPDIRLSLDTRVAPSQD
jgi:hypothetical protein